MDRLRAGSLCCIKNLIGHQIALIGWGRANMHRLIGHFYMGRIRVGIGIDRNRLYARHFCCADHTAGSFTAIGD